MPASAFFFHAFFSPGNDTLREEGDILSRVNGVKADADAGGAFCNSRWVDGLCVQLHAQSRSGR